MISAPKSATGAVVFALVALFVAHLASAEVSIEELDQNTELPADHSVNKCIGLDATDCDAHVEEQVHAELARLDDEFKGLLSKLSKAFDQAKKKADELDFIVDGNSLMSEAIASIIEPNQLAIEDIDESVDAFCSKVLDSFGDMLEALSSQPARGPPQVDHQTLDSLKSTRICKAHQKAQLDMKETQETLIRQHLYPKLWGQLVKAHEKLFSQVPTPGGADQVQMLLGRLYSGYTSNLNEIIKLADESIILPNKCTEQGVHDRQQLIRFYGDYPSIQDYLSRNLIAQYEFCDNLAQQYQQQQQQQPEAQEQEQPRQDGTNPFV